MSDESNNLDDFIRPDNLGELLEQITPSIYELLREAVALGKWGDGTRLSPEQLEHCMQAIILYEAEHLPEAERTGALLASCPSSQQTH